MDTRCLAAETSVAGDTRMAVGRFMNRQMKPTGICPSPVLTVFVADDESYGALPDRDLVLKELQSPPVGGARQTTTSTNP
jgi:hypothetical protein